MLLCCWWERKLVQPLWKTVWRVLKKLKIELPCDPGILMVAQWKWTQLVSMRMQVQSLVLLSGLWIWGCCELWCRSQVCSDLVLLCLWHRPAVAAPVRSLAWELPYAALAALKKKKKRITWSSNPILVHLSRKKPRLEKTHVPQCSLMHYIQ